MHSLRWSLLLALVAIVFVRAADPEPPPAPSEEVIKKWAGLAGVIVGKLDDVKAGPVASSIPPIYNHRLTVDVEQVISGKLKKGKQIISHTVRQMNEPTFPKGKKVIIGIKDMRGTNVAVVVEEVDEKTLKQVRAVLAIPLGWTAAKGKWVSAWASLGRGFWPESFKSTGGPVCSVTGRPALLTGSDVEMTVEPVEPKVKIKFGNPDGDGEYKITLTNNGKEAITVPALLTDGREIRWAESLVIVCQNVAYPIPGARKLPPGTKSVTLKPGESVSGVVNALSLSGPEWPKGGYRIEFTFALGEKSVTKSFYYLSKHHDPLRDAAQAPFKKK
jgi:hypothetical protein